MLRRHEHTHGLEDAIRRFLKSRSARTAARLVGAVPAGFAAISIQVAMLAALGAALGVARGDAVVLSGMVGFVMYLAWLVWAFAVRRIALIYVVALVGASGSAGLLWLMHGQGS